MTGNLVARPRSTPKLSSFDDVTTKACAIGRPDVGAKLGAILYGPCRMAVDTGGLESPQFRAPWTLMDACGHRLDIYGSGGWVFESPRAR